MMSKVMMLSYMLALTWWRGVVVVAWYDTSNLPLCQGEHWPLETDSLKEEVSILMSRTSSWNSFVQFKFGPVTPTPPYSEGEFYTVLDRNVSIQVGDVRDVRECHNCILCIGMVTLAVLEEFRVVRTEVESGYWHNINRSHSLSHSSTLYKIVSRKPHKQNINREKGLLKCWLCLRGYGKIKTTF